MLPTDQKLAREAILSEGIAPFAEELLLAEPVHFAAFIALDLHVSLAEIVNEAANFHFTPGFITLGNSSSIVLGWNKLPEICLDLCLNREELQAYFRLFLSSEGARVQLDYIAFANSDGDPDANTRFLAQTLQAQQFMLT
ncbi:hypothetical protein [Notoacmeibacter sp. MSK16QG-6]|uniref:hypothetical protein n=1 Tax=Notoacmeibacter sp. MSK16QG-6 TaxID=2957982 RepID=UPI00209E50DC|nr:hypothetical protein [Notoacmeibacter sp. MSK16QG-6]MCP1200903.1 hypothetical protein [Notoacmeibacter sp. MSK16QG-6]